jgi:hypothetical protein
MPVARERMVLSQHSPPPTLQERERESSREVGQASRRTQHHAIRYCEHQHHADRSPSTRALLEFHHHIRAIALSYAMYLDIYSEAKTTEMFASDQIRDLYKDKTDLECRFLPVPSKAPPKDVLAITSRRKHHQVNYECIRCLKKHLFSTISTSMIFQIAFGMITFEMWVNRITTIIARDKLFPIEARVLCDDETLVESSQLCHNSTCGIHSHTNLEKHAKNVSRDSNMSDIRYALFCFDFRKMKAWIGV